MFVHRGFEQHQEGESHTVWVSETVIEFLEKHNSNRRKDVMKIGQILTRISEYGLQSINNTEQLRREGKYPDGCGGSSSVSVYAIKAHQLRVYGGLVKRGQKSDFYCIEAKQKKKDKADRNQLLRVAKSLGELK
jgi:hypothetical protein